MKHTQFLLLILLGPVLLFSAATSAASQELTVHHVQELEFGDQIFPGIDMGIGPTDPGAAEFVISGEAGKQVQLRFHLPDHMQNTSGNTMNILFSSAAAGYHLSVKGKSTAVRFDPKSSVVTSLNAEGKLYLWLGALITPRSYQTGSSYSADVMLDVSYAH